MSKLDRFLVSINLFNTFPNISTITLERYLSDHRPILLREQHFDYGPIPFKFYHYWMELDGFCNVVEVAWKDSPCDDSNAISCFMGKLKFLKNKIREWNKLYMASRKHVKDKYLADLEEVEGIIDSGGGNDEIAMKRAHNPLNLLVRNHTFQFNLLLQRQCVWEIHMNNSPSQIRLRKTSPETCQKFIFN
uniref:RNA-directed DNA polymerase, eukaryota n=1 Tax=Tanacetum cinerariifolium TaxID=118510 RepID=A0A699RIK0_TANCI|nr:RNA-directed DNA polymerase, eukaryota [Tanacetum cinerariifolium]